jgi:hypothetical protein
LFAIAAGIGAFLVASSLKMASPSTVGMKDMGMKSSVASHPLKTTNNVDIKY